MANLVNAPRKWRNKAILIKPEAIYGIDSTPTGLVNWIEARNVQLVPMEVDKVARNIDMPYMGNSGDIVTAFWAKLSFDVAAAPSGVAGTAPKYAPLIMACGTAETVTADTSVAYNLISTGHGSLCAYINIDGVLHKLFGQRGEVKCKMDAKGIPMFSFSFDSLYVMPVVGAMPTIVRTGWAIEEGVNSVNTGPAMIDGIALSFSTLDWSFGNKIARVNLPGPQLEIVIDDRSPQASATVLAPDLATFNPFALVEAKTVVPFSCTHGSSVGKKLKTDMQVRVIGVDYDKIEGMVAYKLTMQPVPVAGNDEIALTFL